MEDPLWPRASAWLDGAGSAPADAPLLAVVGAPLSQASISESAAHETPAALRDALRRYAPFAAVAGTTVDLAELAVQDLGDLPLVGLTNEAAQEAVEAAARDVVAGVDLPRPPDLLVLLGGDNAITRPAVRGGRADLSRVGLLTLDAHHDVRGFHDGPTNGTPVRGLIEDGLDGGNVVQVGIGAFTNSRAYRTYVDEQGITAVTVDEARTEGVERCVRRHLDDLAARCTSIYVDLDVDVLDRVFAPGCPGARPGGLAPHELHAAARAAGAHPGVFAVDIVEVDAVADQGGITVDNAALCLLHVAAGLVQRRGGHA